MPCPEQLHGISTSQHWLTGERSSSFRPRMEWTSLGRPKHRIDHWQYFRTMQQKTRLLLGRRFLWDRELERGHQTRRFLTSWGRKKCCEGSWVQTLVKVKGWIESKNSHIFKRLEKKKKREISISVALELQHVSESPRVCVKLQMLGPLWIGSLRWDFESVHGQQVPSWSWCCRSGDDSLKTTDPHQGFFQHYWHLGPDNSCCDDLSCAV